MSPAEIAIAAVAMAVGAIVKSITGVGMALVAIPIVALFVPVEQAIAVVAIPNLAMNLALAASERGSAAATRDLPVIATFGVVGAIVGTAILVSVPEKPLMIALALVVFAYVATNHAREGSAISEAATKRWAPVAATLAGVMQGAVGISGPVVAAWFHGYRLPRGAYVLSVTLVFAISGLAQVVVLAATGRYDSVSLSVVAFAAIIPTLALMPFGAWVRDKMPADVFDRAVLGILTVSAMALVVRAAL